MLNINFSEAYSALQRYNRPEVVDIDQRAMSTFRRGLGGNELEIECQLDFVCNQYGGLARPPTNGLLAEIAQAVMQDRDSWIALLSNAQSLCFLPKVQDTVDFSDTCSLGFEFTVPGENHYSAFAPLRDAGGVAQTRCMTKFLHLLSPQCFVVQDRWIGKALGISIPSYGAPDAYADFASLFCEFADYNRDLLKNLRQFDRPKSWSEIKLVDKILLCRDAGILKHGLAA